METKCCNRPSIATMDHRKYSGHDYLNPVQMVNRCCTKCWAHWYGPTDAVRSYTRAEWDRWINSAFTAQPV